MQGGGREGTGLLFRRPRVLLELSVERCSFFSFSLSVLWREGALVVVRCGASPTSPLAFASARLAGWPDDDRKKYPTQDEVGTATGHMDGQSPL